jgi:Skp family chaperone for outer membrane proteins
MLKIRLIPAAIAVFVISGVLWGCAAYGQAAKPADIKIGVVDVDRVAENYTEAKTAREQLVALRTQFADALKMRQKYSLLSPAELDELEKLGALPKPEAKDTARIQELQKKGDALAAELATLRNKKDLSDTEKARLKELTDIALKANADLEARGPFYDDQLAAKQKDMEEKMQPKMEAAIAEVAKQKGLWTVIDKSVIHWGCVDITDDLIAKLNKEAGSK